MSVNFFDATCQEPPLNHVLFGLCDDQGGAGDVAGETVGEQISRRPGRDGWRGSAPRC